MIKVIPIAKAIAVVFASLALTTTAIAGNPNLCAKDGWASAQSASSSSFSSMKECAKAREVFRPSLEISPTHVGADEQFSLIARGFHPSTTSTVFFAIAGEAPYGSYVPFYSIEEDGSFFIPFVFAACRLTDTGQEVPVDLTITFVDSFGVHASAGLTLC